MTLKGAAAVPTLDEFKQQVNVTSQGSDFELQATLDAAVGLVEGIVGPLTVQSVTETHYGVTGSYIVLNRPRVVAITAVSVQPVGWIASPVSYLAADVQLNVQTGVVRLPIGYCPRGDVTVTYTAGFASEPAAVRLATLIVAAHLWETQRGAAPLPLAGGGGELPNPGLGFALPNRALELLASYATPATVA
jgi:hypothetical protein